jgi:CBS-domain-containing membrane protein
MKSARVADLMTRDVAVIGRDRDVHELEKLLLEKRVHGVPVVDERGVLVGVVSQSDLLAWHFQTGLDGAAFYDYSNLVAKDDGSFKGLQLSDIQTAKVQEIMSPLAYCIFEEQPVALAAARMVTSRIHRLVVVDDERRVLGIISALDLLRSLPDVEELFQSHEETGADCSEINDPSDSVAESG